MIYIKHLDKTELLYALWEYARFIPYCCDLKLTKEKAKKDLNYMIANNRELLLTTYYGKMLFVDISLDYFDPSAYDIYNGRGLAKKIIYELKSTALQHCIASYYKSF